MAVLWIKNLKYDQKEKTCVAELIADTKTDLVPEGDDALAEITDLPAGYEISFGSRAICADTLAVGVLDSEGTWHFTDD